MYESKYLLTQGVFSLLETLFLEFKAKYLGIMKQLTSNGLWFKEKSQSKLENILKWMRMTTYQNLW